MDKTVRFLLAGCLAVFLLVGTFSGGVVAGWFMNDARSRVTGTVEDVTTAPTVRTPVVSSELPKNEQPPSNASPEELEELFAPFWQAWDLVHKEYVDQPVDDEALMRGAIRGMMDGLGDQHSSYMDPEEFKQANMPMDGEYEGIGAYVDTTGEYLTITTPMPGSPAEAAGLRPNDKIIAVDGEDMTGVDGSLVLQRVLGPAGSEVVLTILREGEEPFDVTITRATIVLKSVEYEMLENDIAYVKLTTFGEDTTADLKAALRELMDQNPSSMILDLRNNGGGYLTTAIEVVSQFVGEGVVMYEEYGSGEMQSLEAIPGGLATEIPLVVLVNEGTASASEITAGAIQDYGRGTLLGMKTFGKGSVQNWIPLRDEQGAVRVTVARWLTPNERQIHQIGLEPDVVVELTEEDFLADLDPQLDAAVELLSQGN